MKTLSACLTGLAAALVVAGCRSAPPPRSDATAEPELSYAPIRVDAEIDPQSLIEEQQRNAVAERAMATPVTMESEYLSIRNLINFLHEQTNANIVVNWHAIDLVGITPNTMVYVNVTDVPAHSVLELALAQASAEAFDDDKADFIFNNGVVEVSCRRDFIYLTTTRIYDIRWFLNRQETLQFLLYHNHPRADELRAIILQNPTPLFPRRSDDNNDNGGEGLFFADDNDGEIPIGLDYRYSTPERIDLLEEHIQFNTGEPDRWIDGDYTIWELDGYLIISTTRESHDKIAAILAAMRQMQIHRFREQTRLIEVFLLLEQAEAYRLDQDYRRALERVEAALRVDPNSLEAAALREVLRESMGQ